MLYSFTITNPKNLPLDEEYAHSASWLARLKGKTVEFDENITFLCGPNGSGKTALLSTIANAHHCSGSGVPTLTQRSILQVAPFNSLAEAVWGRGVKEDTVHDGISFDSDGSLVFFVRGGILDDFYNGGDISLAMITRKLDRRSSGESTSRDFCALLESFRNIKEIRGAADFLNPGDGERSPSARWRERASDAMYAYTASRNKKVKPTIIFDEAEANLDITSQVFFLKILFEQVAQWAQVIFTSHSPLVYAMLPKNAKIIETKRGYFKRTKHVLDDAGFSVAHA